MKKIILCGKSCTGKTTLKNLLISLGYTGGVSYTTRKKRDSEINGQDYHFITEEEFISEMYLFFEWDRVGDAYYGTTNDDFLLHDVFILTPKAIKNMPEDYRKDSLVIYLDASLENRIQRAILRGDTYESIIDRIPKDCHTFSEFKDFDVRLEIKDDQCLDDFMKLFKSKQ